ncbi:MAG: TorF family putative porin [Sphingomonadaceae bacterium]|nr:TorF family putative porin [Sphingomonadaceae bacterium]
MRVPIAAAVFALSTPIAAQAQAVATLTDAPPAPAAAPAGEPAPALAITGSAALVSQYRFRGISLSNEDPTVQATINLNHETGAYAGVWASGLDGFGELGGSNLELDLYGGYKLPLGGATLDVGLLYYAYPGSTGGDFEFFEPYANLSGTVGAATLKAGVNYAWDQSALGGHSNLYVYGDAGVALGTAPITLKAHVGYSEGDTALSPTGSVVDWLVGADIAWRNLILGIAYVDTDLSDSENRRFVDPDHNITNAAVVVSLTASF